MGDLNIVSSGMQVVGNSTVTGTVSITGDFTVQERPSGHNALEERICDTKVQDTYIAGNQHARRPALCAWQAEFELGRHHGSIAA
jgi:hypothetical protein